MTAAGTPDGRRSTAALWPQTLVGRTALVLLAGVLATNLLVIAFLSGDTFDPWSTVRGRLLAEQVVLAAERVAALPPEERRSTGRALRQPGLRVIWTRQPLVEESASGWRIALVRRVFKTALSSRADDEDDDAAEDAADGEPGRKGLAEDAADGLRLSLEPFRLVPPGDWEPPPQRFGRMHQPGPRRAGLPAPAGDVLFGSLPLADGSWVNFTVPALAFRPFWAMPSFPVLVVSTLVVFVLAVWAVRRAVRPLGLLARAAERFGTDIDAPPLAETGPLEVRRAARAFNAMQARLKRFFADRTTMLAAISHDLRTPLTRLRLRAELLDDEDARRRTLADLAEMQAMIAATLDFARAEAAVEPSQAYDLSALLAAVCADAEDRGGSARFSGPPRAIAAGRPLAMKRAFANLIDNAVTHGGGAEVSLASADGGGWAVTIDDFGPGVPEDELERVFRPFYRRERARTRQPEGAGGGVPGVGLGLAIARSVILAHGGRISLGNRRPSGLRVLIWLPR